MLRILIGAAAGLALGGLLGWRSRCTSGTCPILSSPWVGMVFGALFGAAAAWALFPPPVEHASTRADIEAALNDPYRPVLLDFYADWCPPCRRLAPTIDELAKEYAGRAHVLKVNIDKHPELAQRYGVSGIPDIRIVLDGEQLRRMGPASAADYGMALDAAIARAQGAGEGREPRPDRPELVEGQGAGS